MSTPQGLRTGSSVLEVRTAEHTWGLHEMRGIRSSLRGEAVFVDLGQGRNLVAVLGGGPTGSDDTTMRRLPAVAFGLQKRTWEEQQAALTGGALRGRRAEVPAHMLPTLVTFSDLNDPRSAQVVDPAALERVFGPGVRLERAWIEMTDDRVTRGIEKRFAWVGNYAAETDFERSLRVDSSIGPAMLPGRRLRQGF
jgi:hypothetical protein